MILAGNEWKYSGTFYIPASSNTSNSDVSHRQTQAQKFRNYFINDINDGATDSRPMALFRFPRFSTIFMDSRDEFSAKVALRDFSRRKHHLFLRWELTCESMNIELFLYLCVSRSWRRSIVPRHSCDPQPHARETLACVSAVALHAFLWTYAHVREPLRRHVNQMIVVVIDRRDRSIARSPSSKMILMSIIRNVIHRCILYANS